MRPAAYYNEIDPFCCAWLRNLMDAGLVMRGEIDSRSIADVKADDLRGFARVHFFAGIAGWDYALQLAGWPEDQPVWTGSCPCQPFSVAGKGRGTEDERHLWPVMHRLIAECHPATVFGEQVASAAGRDWLAGVRTDLEALAYAVGGADLCAAGVAAPHIRQRLYWVADADDAGPQGWGIGRDRAGQRSPWASGVGLQLADGSTRRVEPAIFPLAHGVPNRVGILRGAGNAVVPQVAAEFITAFMECRP